MGISLAGVLPVSSINLGLAMSIAGIGAQVTKLTADVAGLAPALAAQLAIAANPPSLSDLATALAAQLTPTNVALSLNPGGVAAASANLNADTLLQLGLIEAQLAVAVPISEDLQFGLTSGSIAGWNYVGGAVAFGTSLEEDTARGYGRTPAGENIVAVIFATESLSSWNALSEGFNTGPVLTGASDAQLSFMGELGGGSWNTAAAKFAASIGFFVAELEGLKASLEAKVQVTLGLSLPDPDLQLSIGANIVANIGIEALFGNLSVKADIEGAIGGLQAEIDALIALAASLNAQLSASGITCWTYSGRADGLGAALRGAIAGGLPGGSGPLARVYGLALAGSAPAMGTFGVITKTS